MLKLITSLICICTVLYNCKRKRLVSSNSLWILCYFLIMVLYPIMTEKEYMMARTIDICAFVGIIFFGAGTVIASKLRIVSKVKKNKKEIFISYKSSYFCYLGIVMLFLLFEISTIGIGGISGLLLGTTTANQLTFDTSTSSIFIYLMNLMVPFVIATWMQATKKTEKIGRLMCLGSFIVISLVFGYTRLFLICVLLIILFFEIRGKNIKQQAIILGVAIVGMTIAMVFLNFLRYFGTGNISSFSEMISLDYIFESTDFSASYQWFDELLKYESPYIFPITYLKPLFVFIPRSIWTSKPEPLSLEILRGINPELISSGYTSAGNSVLGEGYAIMGWLGIAIAPLIWGFICTMLDKKYYERLALGKDKSLWNICYYFFSTFIILSCQRGDWSQYNVIIVWLFIVPLYCVSKIRIKLIGKE